MERKKTKIGVVAFSDEREYIHRADEEYNKSYLEKMKRMLEAYGEAEIVLCPTIVHKMAEAVEAAKQFRASDVAGVVMVYNMWTFAREAAIFARVFGGHVLSHTNQDPTRPALVGLLCSSGTLDKMGINCPRIIGDISRPDVQADLWSWIRAARTAYSLVGETYCNFGGRSMGMGTAVRDPNDWIKRYGVDVEQIDQVVVLEEAKKIPEKLVKDALDWLTKNIGKIDERVPREKIENQIRLYEAVKEILRKNGLDFYGIKCQPELSQETDFAVPCLNQAFSNNNFDWEGEKEPVVCACEADMGAAMTMRLLQGVSGLPVLFMDFRDYSQKYKDFIFCNCGSQSVFYAKDLKDVHLVPVDKYYPSGGAHVQYVCRDGEVTLARLCEDAEGEWMAIVPGRFKYYSRERCAETSPLWPHAYLEADVEPAELLAVYGSNHGHAVFGNYTRELVHLGKMLGFRTRVFGKEEKR